MQSCCCCCCCCCFDFLVAVAVVDAKALFFLAPCVEVSWRSESTKTCRKCGSCEYSSLGTTHATLPCRAANHYHQKIIDLSLTLSNFYRRSVSRNRIFHGKIRTSKSMHYRFFGIKMPSGYFMISTIYTSKNTRVSNKEQTTCTIYTSISPAS